jgi:glucuronate isomerase
MTNRLNPDRFFSPEPGQRTLAHENLEIILRKLPSLSRDTQRDLADSRTKRSFRYNEKPSASNADRLFDTISEKLSSPEFSPRNSSNDSTSRFCAPQTQPPTGSNITRPSETLAGKEKFSQPSAQMPWSISMRRMGTRTSNELSEVSGIDVIDYRSFIQALEQRREFFKSMGATATDHAALTPATAELIPFRSRHHFPARA